MTLTVYHLKTCDTCRKAIKALQASGGELTLIDVRSDGMPDNVLADLLQQHGWEAVLNRRSTTWRSLSDADKDISSNADAADLIKAHPTLIKRPVIIAGDETTIGWNAAAQAAWL